MKNKTESNSNIIYKKTSKEKLAATSIGLLAPLTGLIILISGMYIYLIIKIYLNSNSEIVKYPIHFSIFIAMGIFLTIMTYFIIYSFILRKKHLLLKPSIIKKIKNSPHDWFVAGKQKKPDYFFHKKEVGEIFNLFINKGLDILPEIIEVFNSQNSQHQKLKELRIKRVNDLFIEQTTLINKNLEEEITELKEL